MLIGHQVRIGDETQRVHSLIEQLNADSVVESYLQLEYLRQVLEERLALLRPELFAEVDARMAERGRDDDRHTEKLKGACFTRIRGYRYGGNADYRALRTQLRLLERAMRKEKTAVRAPALDTLEVNLSGSLSNAPTKEEEL